MNKVHVHATLDPKLVEWMDKRIEDRKYSSRTHCIEVALMELRKKETIKL